MLLEDLVWGLYPVFAHLLVAGRDPILTAGLASTAAALPFLGYLAARGRLRTAFPRGTRLGLAFIALTATVLASICFFIGVSNTSGINASLLGQSEAIYSLLLSALLLKEAVTRRQLLATLLLVAGAVAVTWQGGLHLAPGDALILATPLFYQLGHVTARKLFPLLPDPMAVPAARLGLGGPMLILLGLILHPDAALQLVDPKTLLQVGLFGMLFIGLEKLIWYEAIRRIDLAKATALLVPSVAVGVLGAFVVLGETPHQGQWLGMLLMLAGLALLSLGQFDGSTARTSSP